MRASGTANADTVVAVTGAGTASKKDRTWFAEITPANAAGPVKANAAVYAAKLGGGSGGADLVKVDNSRTYFVPALHQVMTYDADGNLKSDGVWNYTYNAENQLVRMASVLPAGFTGMRLQLDFKYDYQGRRVEKRVYDNDVPGGETLLRRYLYDGFNLIAETDAAGALKRTFTWGLDLAGTLTATGGVGALLQINDLAESAAYSVTYDGNGNIASLLDPVAGTQVAVYEYDPSGNLLRCEGTYAKKNPFRFSTKWHDDESGLINYGFRYYSPTLGRFINRDPIAEKGGLNLYGFVGNDSVNRWDYLGFSWFSKTIRKALKWVNNVVDKFASWLGQRTNTNVTINGSVSTSVPIGPTPRPGSGGGSVYDATHGGTGVGNPGGYIFLVSSSSGTTSTAASDRRWLSSWDSRLNTLSQVDLVGQAMAAGSPGLSRPRGITLAEAAGRNGREAAEAGKQFLYDATIGNYYAGRNRFETAGVQWNAGNYTESVLNIAAGLGNAANLGLLLEAPISGLRSWFANAAKSRMVTVYRGTNLGSEIGIFNESGAVLSDAGRSAYLSARGAGASVEEALSTARGASQAAHGNQLSAWGSLDNYVQAHGAFGQEISVFGPRSMVSFTTDPAVAARFGSTIFEFQVPRSLLVPQTLQGAGEAEVLIINGIRR